MFNVSRVVSSVLNSKVLISPSDQTFQVNTYTGKIIPISCSLGWNKFTYCFFLVTNNDCQAHSTSFSHSGYWRWKSFMYALSPSQSGLLYNDILLGFFMLAIGDMSPSTTTA